jgi:hypothetical protein
MVPPHMVKDAPVSQKAAAAVMSAARDADGDFDGTKPGRFDPKDVGKGLKIDRMA